MRDIATKFHANHYQEGDEHEPLFENGAVQLIPPIKAAWDATVEFGLLGASYDYDEGGVQLPDVISKVAVVSFRPRTQGKWLLFRHQRSEQFDQNIR